MAFGEEWPKDIEKALQGVYKAVQLSPEDLSLWEKFAELLFFMEFKQFDDPLKKALQLCLSKPICNPQDLAIAGISLLKLTPEFDRIIYLSSQKKGDILREEIKQGKLHPILNDPLLLGLLENTLLPDRAIELCFTSLRRALLELYEQGIFKDIAPRLGPFMCALAMQCYFNEYVFSVAEPEKKMIEKLGIDLNQANENSYLLEALYGCYQPLDTLMKPKTEGSNDLYRKLIKAQIEEPLEEEKLKSEIQVFKGFHDEISLKVQEQYEANPYPRWKSLHRACPLSWNEFIRQKIPFFPAMTQNVESRPAVLVAGCGTGQHALNIARQIKNAHVAAIDLSLSSLAYALRKSKEWNIPQMEFYQADILELGDWKKKFHLIECVGVLHHMKDPLAGWKILTQLLEPEGVMLIGLYSSSARQDVVAARKLIAKKGLEPTLEGIRAARNVLLQVPTSELVSQVTLTSDFYTVSGCRDLLFHVHEHHFNLEDIVQMIEMLHLEFLGFDLKNPKTKQEYLRRFPEDPQALSLRNWSLFEKDHPDAFVGMYQFWCMKKNHRAPVISLAPK